MNELTSDFQVELKLRQRIIGYDAIKALAAFLVIIKHIPYLAKWPYGNFGADSISALASVSVPLFFIVNGALLLNKPFVWKNHVYKIVVTIICMEIWKVLTVLFYRFIKIGQESYTFKDVLLYLLGNNKLGGLPVGLFWFFNALIAAYLMLPIIKLLFDMADQSFLRWFTLVLGFFTVILPTTRFILFVLSVITGHNIFALTDPLSSFSTFDNSAYVLLYFILGGLVSHNALSNKTTKQQNHKTRGYFLSLCWLGIIVCCAINYAFNYYKEMRPNSELADFTLQSLLQSVVLTVLLLMLFIPIRITSGLSKAISFFGSNTFGVYMLHYWFISFLRKLQDRQIFALPSSHSEWIMFGENLIAVFAIYLLCNLISWTFSKIPIVSRIFTLK